MEGARPLPTVEVQGSRCCPGGPARRPGWDIQGVALVPHHPAARSIARPWPHPKHAPAWHPGPHRSCRLEPGVPDSCALRALLLLLGGAGESSCLGRGPGAAWWRVQSGSVPPAHGIPDLPGPRCPALSCAAHSGVAGQGPHRDITVWPLIARPCDPGSALLKSHRWPPAASLPRQSADWS